MSDPLNISSAWRHWRARVDLEEYSGRWDRLASEGHHVHGEADFVDDLFDHRPGPPPAQRSLLDGGCGTGRVAIELHRRGWRVVGVDNDIDLLQRARQRAPDLRWLLADLATVTVDQPDGFDVVLLAGDVLRFVEPDDRGSVIANLASHLATDGCLVVGGGTDPVGAGPADIDRWADRAGLAPVERHRGWGRERYDAGPYQVVVYRLGNGQDRPDRPGLTPAGRSG